MVKKQMIHSTSYISLCMQSKNLSMENQKSSSQLKDCQQSKEIIYEVQFNISYTVKYYFQFTVCGKEGTQSSTTYMGKIGG